jgi:hypothetical protein
VWRHLSAGFFEKKDAWFSAGMAMLKRARLGTGKWRTYPFYYTVLALLDMDLPAALDELRYAAPALERSLKRKASEEPFSTRRAMVAERALARI